MRTLSSRLCAAVLCALSFVAAASAQITLVAPATPLAGQPGSAISITGNGFSGTIAASGVQVTVTPPAGSGTAVTFGASLITNTTATKRTVTFVIPVSLTTATPLNCLVTIATTDSVNSHLTTVGTGVPLTVNPPPTIGSVSPGATPLGSTVTIAVNGLYTAFTNNTAVSLQGPGALGTTTISQTGATTWSSAASVSATFNIPSSVPIGAYTVIAKTGTQMAQIVGGFLISAAGPLSLTSITPNSVVAGQPATITVVGNNTHFVNGATVASFGNGITAGAVTVTDSTHARFPITTDPIAFLGARTLTIATGGEYATATFTLTTNGSTLSKVGTTLPAVCATGCFGAQGTNVTLQLTGAGTHWIQAGTVITMGGGIAIGNITVASQTSLTVNISIGAGVATGSYPVTATTNGEIVSLANAFSVTAATPYLSSAAPSSGVQGATNFSVVFTGVSTSFNTGALTANFGSNVTVISVTPSGPLSATAIISIDPTAAVGARSGALASNGTIYAFSFTVTASNAALSSVTPNTGFQGASVALQVTSANTHWVQGLTFASLGSQIVVNRVVIGTPATSAEVDITIPATASLGSVSLTMSTNGEIVTLPNAFTVLPYTPTMTLSPSSGMIPVAPATSNTVTVNFSGNFTNFNLTQTIAAIDGNGVAIQSFKVLNQFQATAQFVITADLTQASPQLPCTNAYGGNHVVTVETPLASGSEIVHAGFCVTSTPAVLTSISPFHSPEPVNNLTVTITGVNTHFGATTTVGFGPNITMVPGTLSIGGKTSLSVQVNIPSNAVLGWRPVFVNTIDAATFINEQLSIGFAIDPPATATLVSVSPNSGIQGQSLIPVQITGNLTNWATGKTTAIFGAGITVNSLVINGLQSATAMISIDAVNAPIGTSGVTMVTQLTSGVEEIVSGPLFAVTAGNASIDHIGPACTANNSGVAGCQQHALALHQGDVVTMEIFGGNTHWLGGETTMDFGPDIAITQLVVKSPTEMTCQFAISYNATIGLRGGTATTNAEKAPSFTDALNILPVQPTNISLGTHSGQQGATFDILVTGTGTHWTSTAAQPADDTTASFGNNNGVNVTGITVTSATTMTLHMQIAGTAYTGTYTLTITTTGVTSGPQSTEQIVLANVFSVVPGVAYISYVAPTSGTQSSTGQITVTGVNTNFATTVTTAYFSTGGCLPAFPAGINVTSVTASSKTAATLSIAVSATAPTGYQTLCMYTQGEVVAYANAYQVLPGTPTLNQVQPVNGQQGQTLSNAQVSILGQFTHWQQGLTTVTFGQGVSVQNLLVTGSNSLTATLVIDGAAYTGSRTVTVTTGSEIVSGNLFTVTPSAAIITSISPTSANQGQRILMTINGDFTHWSQELTQFSISGGGYDIKVNGVVINSATQAVADLSILNVSGNSGLGTRTISMSTVGENVTLASALLITGGVPSIVSISNNYGTRGDNADNIRIAGQFTAWDSTSLVDFGDPAITVLNTTTINDNFNITAVINIGAGATLGVHTVSVRTGTKAQTGQFTVYNPAAPPTPYISYEYPSVALAGQTLAVNFVGAYTNWLPGQTSISFGAGINVNSVNGQYFDVTGVGSGTANITILPGATVGPRTVQIVTGSQVLTTTFYVTIGTPQITVVDTNTAIQGETRLLDLVGQYTTWTSAGLTPTQFTFCPAVTSASIVQIFGPTAARVSVTIDPEAATGYCLVKATTGSEVAQLGGGGYFGITSSTATITAVTPNTAPQNTTTSLTLQVQGFATNWDNTTVFSFSGGSNISIVSQSVTGLNTATLKITTALYAYAGLYSLTATTRGEVATMQNAFVVTPGTPILDSTTNGQNKQQSGFTLGILAEYTKWTTNPPTVSFPNGGVTAVNVAVTSDTSLTVTGTVLATAFTGCGPIVVTTPGQTPPVLTLYGAFCINAGPAAITGLSPNNLGQGQPGAIQIIGANTNWVQGTTVGDFGPGISLTKLTIINATTATANVTVGANATPEANNVTLTTAGEVSRGVSAFTIFAMTPVLLDVFPNSGTQGDTNVDVCIVGAYTHFVDGNTTANFGPGIVINKVNINNLSACPGFVNDGMHADVNISISPIAGISPGNVNHVQLVTTLATTPVTQEVAVWQNSSATTQYNYAISAGTATISSVTPFAPLTVHQNDVGDILHIAGAGTHFLLATPSLNFCYGVSPVGTVNVVDNTHITVTVSLSQYATVGACSLSITTGGEAAQTTNAFTILAGLPVITSASPNSEPQNAGVSTPIAVTIYGLYTHFTSGALSVAMPAGVTGAIQPGYTDTQLTVNVTVGPTAATGIGNIQVRDTTDGPLTATGAFTVTAGIPVLYSVNPASGNQALPQPVVLTGNYTGWTSASVVTVSGGSDVTVSGTPAVTNTGYQQQLAITFNVTNGAAATARTVCVTTGGQQQCLNNAFTVLPGVPTILSISPNIGVPNSSVPVTITGVFTNWDSTTTINFGNGISVNNFAEGADGTPSSYNTTTLHATLTIDANSAISLGTHNVEVTTLTGGTQHLWVLGGFTVQSNTTTPPVVSYVSPASSATGVPINTRATVSFSEPLSAATITAASAILTDQGCYASTASQILPQSAGYPSLDATGRNLSMAPQTNLQVGHTYYIVLNSYYAPSGTAVISDQSGNHLAQNVCYSFITGFAPDTSGPTLVSANIAPGASAVPTNSKVILGFNKPVNPATVFAALSFTQSGSPVAGGWGYNSDFTQLIFTPATTLAGSANSLVIATTSLTDSVGTPLTAAVSLPFTTAAATDTSSLSLVSYTPPNSTTLLGTSPVIRMIFNKPVNPLSFTPGVFYLYDYQNNATVLGTGTSFSPDNRTASVTLPSALLPGTQYRMCLCSVYDWTTVNSYCSSYGFTTGPGADTLTFSAISASPAGGATLVPVNPQIYVNFNKPVDPTSVTSSSIGLTPSVTGTVSVATNNGTDYSTLVFRPSANLAAGTLYTINVAGVSDMDGNPMSAFTPVTFQTASSATADTTNGTITGTPYPNGATNIATNVKIVLTFSKVVDLLTLNANSVRVFDNSQSGVSLPGTLTSAPGSSNNTIMTYTPAALFVPGHQICYYVSYNSYVYDLAGNTFGYYASCFTTDPNGATVTSALTVLSVSPANNATGIGPSNPVIVTFSRPVNPGTLTNNVALYNGSALVTSGYSASADYTTIVFSNGYLPFSATFTVAISPNVTDLYGNHLGAEYRSVFSTGAAPVTTQPTVATLRPASGATGIAATNPVTLFFSAPMNPATLGAASLKVSQNGALISSLPGAAFAVSADNQAVTFTPAGGSFQPGALISIWATSAATDASGNPLYNYQSQYTAQADLSATNLNALSYTPCQYCTASDRQSVVEILLNKPVTSGFSASNFYVTDSGGNPVTGAVSLLDNNRLMRFQLPSGSSFTAGVYYYVHATANLKDGNNLSYAGLTSYYFYVPSTTGSAAPSVVATAPTNGASAIGVNAVISVTFSGNVDVDTLDPSNITLNDGAIPLSISYNSSTYVMTITPQSPLPASTIVTLVMTNVTDLDGNALAAAGSSLTFTVAPAPDYSSPTLAQSNISNGQSGVPVTTSVSLVFNKPIDWRAVVPNSNVYITDSTLGTTLNCAVSPLGSNGIYLTHATPFPVNHTFRVEVDQLGDLNGNRSSYGVVNIQFTSVLVAPSGGPVVTRIIPPAGSTAVPVNFRPMVQFDRPIDPSALSGITLQLSGSPVPAIPVLSAGNTVVTLVPSSLLAANNAGFVVTAAGTQDSGGNAQSGSAAASFTTAATFDLTLPAVASVSPISNSTTGENPVLEVVFNKPINPITSSGYTFYNYNTGRAVTGSALAWALDLRSVQFTYPGQLEPNSRYYWYLNTMTDLAGNSTGMGGESFYTSATVDQSPESVISATPPAGQTGVPANAVIQLQLAKPASPITLATSSVTLSPGVSGYAVQLSSDGMAITLAHGTLAANQVYTIHINQNAFTDENSNGVNAYSSTFTTGSSIDTSSGAITLQSPANQATGIALTGTQVVVTFSKPFDVNSINSQSLVLCPAVKGCNYQIAGSLSYDPTYTVLTFTPSVALPAGAQIDIYAGYFSYIQDLAGNNFNWMGNQWFVTASTTDTTPPAIVSVNPSNNATNVGPNAPIVLTFNKSLDYTTINSGNFALYNGSTLVSASVSYSADRSIVTLSTTLPYSAALTVAVSTNVVDYNGNHLAAPYTYTFSTETPPLNSNPRVLQSRPSGSGAGLTTPITLFTNAPMNLASVQSGIYVAQNGALIAGTASLTADQQGIVWTPQSGSFAAGALIEVYLQSPAADTSGNLVTSYSYSFHTVTVPGLTTAPTETANSPCKSCGSSLGNPMVEIQFSQPLDSTTISSANAYVSATSAGPAVSGTPVLANGGALLRIPVSGGVSPYDYYVHLSSTIKDTNGNFFAGDTYSVYLYNSFVPDHTPPQVSSITPADQDTGIGDNAPIRLVFSKLVDTLTVNPYSVTLWNGAPGAGTKLPYTVSFSTISSGTQTTAVLTPQAPLPDNATITVTLNDGIDVVTDFAGNPVAKSSGLANVRVSAQFTTRNGADFTAPAVQSLSIDNHDNSGIPLNSTFTIVFSKALDPSTVTPSGFYVEDYSVGNVALQPIVVSADGRTVTMLPLSNLGSGHSGYFYWCSSTDLSGNSGPCGSQSFNTTGSAADTTGPSVVTTSPVTGSTAVVPTNAMIEVAFNKAVTATSLGSITLTQGGNPAASTASLNNSIYTDDTVVRVQPQQLLLPNTTYTVTAAGVQDIAGYAMSSPYSFSFTTGANFQTVGIVLPQVAVTVFSGGTSSMATYATLPNVTDTPTFTITFDHAVDAISLLHGAVMLRDSGYNVISVPASSLQLSSDQTVVTFSGPMLTPGSTYRLALEVGSIWFYDLAGNQTSGWSSQYYTFTAH